MTHQHYWLGTSGPQTASLRELAIVRAQPAAPHSRGAHLHSLGMFCLVCLPRRTSTATQGSTLPPFA